MNKLKFGKQVAIASDGYTKLSIQPSQTFIENCTGKHEDEAEIAVGLFDENSGEEAFIVLSTDQVDVLIGKLQHLNSKVKEYNSTF